MPAQPFQSYAQNGEDVVLWRAFGRLEAGRYVDVGANDPTEFSISRAFYDAGWSGITVEPVPQWADLQAEQRPRDLLIRAAITGADVDTIVLHEVKDTGLSTLAADIAERHARSGFETVQVTVPAQSLDDVLADAEWQGEEIHFMTVDVEGAEADVLSSINLQKWRPWVLVIEATAPLSTIPTHHTWEPMVTEAGYEFCMFDGVSRYYVAEEHAVDLRASLGYPACALDSYISPYRRAHEAIEADLGRQLVEAAAATRAAEGDRALAEAELVRWRAQALSNWSAVVAREGSQAEVLRLQIEAIKATLSWRVTKPLRAVRRLRGPV